MVFFLRLRFVRVLRCSLMSLSSLCGRLRVFSFFQPLIFGTFSSRFRSFGGSAPLVCAPAADFVAIDFAPLRRFTYFLKSRATVTQLSGLVGPGLGSGTAAKSIKNMQVFKHFPKKSSKHAGFLTFFVIAGRNRLLWDRADQLLCARCGLGERPYFHHMPPETGSINFYAHAADLVNVHICTVYLQKLCPSTFMRTLRTW